MSVNSGTRRLYEELGFDVGEGPFAVKGSAYVFHDRWVDAHLPGGREAQMQRLGSLGDHPFFSQIFVAGGMYDIFPLVALGHVCASMRGESLEDFVTMRSNYQAQLDLRHIRKWLVKLASPSAVARRLPSVLTSYFDFGTPETETFEGGIRGRVRNVPRVIGPWLVASIRGFGQHALEVNGAQSVGLRGKVVPNGEMDRGLPMADLLLEFTWR